MPFGWREDGGPRDGWDDRRHLQHKPRDRSQESHQRRRSPPFHETPHYLEPGKGPRHREDIFHFKNRRGEEQLQHGRRYAEEEPRRRQDLPEQGFGERFRDRSPHPGNGNDRQGGQGRGPHRHQNLNHRDKWTPDYHQHVNRNRGEMDGSSRSGYELEEQRFSADERRAGFNRNYHEQHRFEQSRNDLTEPPRRQQLHPGPDFPKPRRSGSGSRDQGRAFEEARHKDSHREKKRSPFTNARPDHDQHRGRPANQGVTRGNLNKRGSISGFGRGWTHGNQTRSVQKEQPRFDEEQSDRPKPARGRRVVEDVWDDHEDDDDRNVTNISSHSLETQHPRAQWGRNETAANVTVITEETLTIKVDMSRPVDKNSSMLYSADRPLCLDLVHVGRQRLDFLSSDERPGSKEEQVVQSGTFAQEIISLVHKVKDVYFGGQGIPLTERFSERKKPEETEEPQEMTLNKRFSSNRNETGLNVNYRPLPDNEEPLFSRQGPLQLLGSPHLRDPDDLRHDLEKRRQERLEGVKVTIAGQSQPQRPLSTSASTRSEGTYKSNKEKEGFPGWSEGPKWKQEGKTAPRKGGPSRPFHKDSHPVRPPSHRHNSRDQNW